MATRAFDWHRPPDEDLIDDCVHCGFCLPTCPTYVLWGEEMDSPRGRIVLMTTGLQEGSEMSDAMAEHFDRCLGCMACVTACPSGVQYDRLIEATRPQVERNHSRSLGERALRKLIFSIFPHPARMRALGPLLVAASRLGVRGRVPRRLAALRAIDRLAPDLSLARLRTRMPEWWTASGARRARVGLLQGCVQRVFFATVNVATAQVLAAEGFDVHAPSVPRCCGALQMHAGEEPGAIARAKDTIKSFEDCDFVAVNAAGCGSAMKDYKYLLEDEPAWAERAEAFSNKVRDITELLAEHEPRAERHPVPMKVAYHDACHLAHAQGVRAQPRAMLSGIPGLELIEPGEQEICCGSAGVYNLLQPRAADELGDRKAANLLATGADAVAAGNPGCALQIGSRLADAGKPVPVYHPIELLARSLRVGPARIT